jgi:hypothetical protein
MAVERYIVLKGRDGWAVNMGADTLSIHKTLEEARAEAMRLAGAATRDGRPSLFMAVVDGADVPDTRPQA